MVIDAFPVNCEIDLVLFRLEYLNDLVDRFVIGESRLTHRGKPKNLMLSELKLLKPEIFSKVEIVEIYLETTVDPWQNEIATREQLKTFIFSTYPKSFYILSDLDEIPSKEQISHLLIEPKNYHFKTPTYYRFANLKLKDPLHNSWKKGVMGHTSIPIGENGGRFQVLPTLPCRETGVHFSWLQFKVGELENKLDSTPHEEIDISETKSLEFFSYVNEYQIDHLGRFAAPGNGLLEFIAPDRFNDIQHALFLKHPEVFASQASPHKKIRRLWASLVVSSLYRFPRYRGEISKTFILRNVSLRSKLRACFILLIFFLEIELRNAIKQIRFLLLVLLRIGSHRRQIRKSK